MQQASEARLALVYLKQCPVPGIGETGSKPSMSKWFINMDGQEIQDSCGDGWLIVLGIRVASGKAFEFERAFAEMDEQSHLKFARSHRRSLPLLQQPPVLIILCIVCIRVQFFVLSRWICLSQARRLHPVPWIAAEFPRDAAVAHPAGGNRIGPDEAKPWHRCRSTQAEKMGEAVPGLVRAGRRAPGGYSAAAR